MAPAQIDAQLLESIGRITVSFEALSHIVELGVWILLFGNDIVEQRAGQIVTAERTFRQNVDLFSCLYRHRYPKQPHQALTTLCGKLQAIEDERNRIIHSRWTRVDASGHAIRTKTTARRKGIDFQFQKMSLPEVATFAEKIAGTAEQFGSFVKEFCTRPFEVR